MMRIRWVLVGLALSCVGCTQPVQEDSNGPVSSVGAPVLLKQQETWSDDPLSDSVKTFVPDDFPVTNEMFHKYSDERDADDKLFMDKVWFSNDSSGNMLAYRLYTDNFRVSAILFSKNDVPAELLKEADLNNRVGSNSGTATTLMNLETSMKNAIKIKSSFFVTNKGFKLGDSKEKVFDYYGKPDRMIAAHGLESCSWNFVGDKFYEPGMDDFNRPIAINSYGYKMKFLFRKDKVVAILFFNEIS